MYSNKRIEALLDAEGWKLQIAKTKKRLAEEAAKKGAEQKQNISVDIKTKQNKSE